MLCQATEKYLSESGTQQVSRPLTDDSCLQHDNYKRLPQQSPTVSFCAVGDHNTFTRLHTQLKLVQGPNCRGPHLILQTPRAATVLVTSIDSAGSLQLSDGKYLRSSFIKSISAYHLKGNYPCSCLMAQWEMSLQRSIGKHRGRY